MRAASAALALFSLTCAGSPAWPPADPGIRASGILDPNRPLQAEHRLTVSTPFSLALAGDLIIARPLLSSAPVPGFAELIQVIKSSDAAFGNLETTLIDIRTFHGAPFPYEGDWANIALPAVAADLKAMGFDIVGRANNHVADWGVEGMRETSTHLNEAGVAYAGGGDNLAIARSPGYYESAKGRVALVSFAMTFRPTAEAMPPHGQAPARPGLSALHLTLKIHVTADAMKALVAADCSMYQRSCNTAVASLAFNGKQYVLDDHDYNEYVPDESDLADIGRSIREARQHADLVLVAVHSHECSWDCDAGGAPQIPSAILKDIAHGAIDSGADVFVATGIHNLGPIEIYRDRPVFYGLSNFFWSDIQEPVPHELFQLNQSLLNKTYEHPERATDYDLTAPLNAMSFANQYTFQSILAQPIFANGRLARIVLYPVWLGYGENLRTSGTPRLETRPDRAREIFTQIEARTIAYGLPKLDLKIKRAIATLEAPR